MNNPFVLTKDAVPSKGRVALNYLIVCVFVLAVFWIALGAIGYRLDFAFVDRFSERIVDGFILTLQVSAVSLVFSLPLGALVAAGKGSRILPLRYLCDLYVKIIRGTPLIMQIYLFFYIVGTAVGVEDRFISGVLILSVFEGAYIAEIIRGSLLSIDATQRDAARAVGFTRAQTFFHIILPQVCKRVLLPVTNEVITLVKDTALASTVAVSELMNVAKKQVSGTSSIEPYVVAMIIYLILNGVAEQVCKWVERKMNYYK